MERLNDDDDDDDDDDAGGGGERWWVVVGGCALIKPSPFATIDLHPAPFLFVSIRNPSTNLGLCLHFGSSDTPPTTRHGWGHPEWYWKQRFLRRNWPSWPVCWVTTSMFGFVSKKTGQKFLKQPFVPETTNSCRWLLFFVGGIPHPTGITQQHHLEAPLCSWISQLQNSKT